MDYTLKFDKTIKAWDEAIPLGNGDLGALIWNKSNKLRFSIDKGGIWDTSNSPELQGNFTYSDIIELVREKNHNDIVKKYDECYNNPTPTKLPTGKIIIDLGVKKNVESTLYFDRAEAIIKCSDVVLKSFIHANENFGLITINKPNIKVSIENPKYGTKKKRLFEKKSKKTVQTLKNIHYDKAEFFEEKNGDITFKYFKQNTYDSCYGIVIAIKEYEGSTLIAYTVGINDKGNFVDECKSVLLGAIKNGYDNSIVSHANWWLDYTKRSSISIENKYIEKQWYYNNYLLASCSRKGKYPMPLQGVWTADNGSLPPWKGDYHHDLNTQMSYTSYLKANRVQEGESFLDYLFSLASRGEKFARNFYGVSGLCLPSVMDIKGYALGGWCQYALSPTNQLWLCQIMARHYYFTKDKVMLEDKIYPYMKKVGEFLFNILKLKNGKYYLPLSSSPEIHDNRLSAFLTPNSNYDLSLMRAFIEDIIKLSKEIGDRVTYDFYKDKLECFDNLAVDSSNVLMLSKDESPFESHRHHSHCMSIYPLRTMKYKNDRDKLVIDSTIKSLEQYGIKNWVGYSLGWMAELYAVQENGDKAMNMLDTFFRYFCTDNGFHSNGDYRRVTNCHQRCRLFTLEANFLATDAVQEMLLYSEDDGIKLFPSLPKSDKNASFENFLAYGGVRISSKLEDNTITYLEINALEDTNIKFMKNDRYKISFELPSDINLKKGDKVVFE